MNRKIGFTTSIPVEVIFSAGFIPVDLNNIFINNKDPRKLIDISEEQGFPANCCSWIKGLYSISDNIDIDSIIAVTHGDCSNTVALREIWESDNFNTIPFSFPLSREKNDLNDEIVKFSKKLKTTIKDSEKVKIRIDNIREKLRKVDELTWQESVVTGFENNLWLVSSSDLNSNIDKFEKELDEFLKEIKKRRSLKQEKRIGYIGVPPIISGIYEFIEENNGKVVYNEIQRQFSMIDSIGLSLTDTYINYTYPYGILARISDISENIKKRQLDGLIHYTQSFCYRQLEDIVLRKNIDIPILTIEGDRPGKIDEQLKMRIENFMAMV